MRTNVIAACGLILPAAALMSGPVFASCSGAAAPVALQSFNASPSSWLDANKGRGDIGAKAAALAAAAVNGSDANFGKNLATVLGSASGDDGVAIGSALGNLGATCSDPKDPGDRADKQFIAENIERNLLTNAAANTAYGQQGGPETAATAAAGGGGAGGGAGGGGSSAGAGSIGSGLPTGGTNSGLIPDGTTAYANAIEALATGSVGSVGGSGVTTSSTSDTLPGGTSSPTSYASYANYTPIAASSGSSGGSSYGPTTVTCSNTLISICGNGAINGNVTLGVFTISNSSVSNSQVIVR